MRVVLLFLFSLRLLSAGSEELVSWHEFSGEVSQLTGIDSESAELLTEAVRAYEEEGDRSLLEALWSGEDSALQQISTTTYLGFVEPDQLITEAEWLRSEYPENEFGVITALIAYSADGVDYVLQEYDTFDEEKLRVILTVTLDADAETKEEWRGVWESKRSEHEALVLRLQDPTVRRSEALRMSFRTIADVFDEELPDSPVLEAFTDIFSMMEEARETASTSDRTDGVKEADRHFYFSRYQQAIESYTDALVDDPLDTYSRYLMGCAQFELGEYMKASTSFSKVLAADDSILSAEYLSRLSAMRVEQPDAPLLHLAWLLSEEMNMAEKLGMMGENDPILLRLMGQVMIGEPGIYTRSDRELLELADDLVEDDILFVGVVLLTSHDRKPQYIEQFAEECPENDLLQKAHFSFLQRTDQYKSPDRILKALDVCRRMEPNNRYYLNARLIWMGSDLAPLASDLYPPDWSEFDDVAALTTEQLALMRQSKHMTEYVNVTEELQSSVARAMAHLNLSFRSIDSSKLSGNTFSLIRNFYDQARLSIELALIENDHSMAVEVVEYLEHDVMDRQEFSIGWMDTMTAEAYYGITCEMRAKVNRSLGVLIQDDFDVEERPLREGLRVVVDDMAFELIPLPSLRNEFALLSAEPEHYLEVRALVLGGE